jgi:hypothetical protein
MRRSQSRCSASQVAVQRLPNPGRKGIRRWPPTIIDTDLLPGRRAGTPRWVPKMQRRNGSSLRCDHSGARLRCEGDDGCFGFKYELVLDRQADPVALVAYRSQKPLQPISRAPASPPGCIGAAGVCQRLVHSIELPDQAAPQLTQIGGQRSEQRAQGIHAAADPPDARDWHEPAARRRVAGVVGAEIAVAAVELGPGVA